MDNKQTSSWLVVRADASVAMGTGHIMRCLALAQAWQDQGGSVAFAVGQLPPVLETRLKQERMQVVRLDVEVGSKADAIATANVAADYHASWVITDGYQFEADYQRWLKAQGVSLLLLDDYGHADYYEADLVLNQNISARAEWYERRSPHTNLLLGTQYALLRREFCSWQQQERQTPLVACKLLVTMGGADSQNVTGKVIEALRGLNSDIETIVIVGGNNPHIEALQSAVQTTSQSIQILQNVQKMPELMAWADIAISAGGSTCWELAFMGLPVLTIILAENQRAIAQELARKGCSICLGDYGSLPHSTIQTCTEEVIQSQKTRHRMSTLSQVLVDGKGCTRIIEMMNTTR